jgi:rhamnosyltransferase
MNESSAVDLSRVAVITPTLNAERYLDLFSGSLLAQGIRPDQLLIIDSESKDNTVIRAQSFGFRVHEIPRREFNHGGTRALATTLVPWAEILVYTTQDAILASPKTLATLVGVFENPEIGAAYGRQLPHADADPFARHACAFNYPAQSVLRDFETRRKLGFKAIFLSDTFAAYRRAALESVGNFPLSVIALEDTYVAAKMMLQDWKTAYVADAAVYHSHNLNLVQLFRRYFDTGVLHAREPWLREQYGEPSGEGTRFVRSEIAWISKVNPILVPKVFLRAAAKYLGYQLGRREAKFSNGLKKRLGNLREYWEDRPEAATGQ